MSGNAVNVTAIKAMFEGVDPSFKRILLSDVAFGILCTVLRAIDLMAISPKACDIFAFARYVALSYVRVVIIGQDPYPDPTHAHGLCFSTLAPTLPASLKAIFGCLEAYGLMPTGICAATPGDLTNWARQGVIMLNLALTTKPGVTRAHVDHWAPYTREVVRAISATKQPLVFMLWGRDAQTLKPLILAEHKDALVLEERHPSPMAQASLPDAQKFRHCDHFVRANAHLATFGIPAIDWNPYADRQNIVTAPIAPVVAQLAALTINPMGAKHVAFTDGSASGNGEQSCVAGYAAIFVEGPLTGTLLNGRIAPARVVVQSGEDKFFWPTNIRAEGAAIAAVLERSLSEPAGSMLEIVTDSEFWINMIESFIPNWLATARTEEDKASALMAHANVDMTTRIWKLVGDVRARGTLTLRHIRGHGKDKTAAPLDIARNALADELACEARKAADFFDRESQLPLVRLPMP